MYDINSLIKEAYAVAEFIARKYAVSLRTDTEDIIQEIVLRIWKKADKVISMENSKSYMCRIAENCCKDLIIKEHRAGLHAQSSTDIPFEDGGCFWDTYDPSEFTGSMVPSDRSGHYIDETVQQFRSKKAERDRRYYQKRRYER